MPATKSKLNSAKGIAMLQRAMPAFTCHFLEVERIAYQSHDWPLMLRCHEIAFPYCFAKLQAIEANPAQEEGLRILRKLAASRQIDQAQIPQVVFPRYAQIETKVVDSTEGNTDLADAAAVVDGEVVGEAE